MYSLAYEAAVNHAMLYEVGSFWSLSTPGVVEGLIKTAAQRKAVGYVNDPVDRGGETKYGVAARANPDLDIRSLDWDGAKRVYYRRYWLAANCDDISEFAPVLAVLHFDGAVNHGVGRANKFLQQTVQAPVDGDIGPMSLKLTKERVEMEGEVAVCHRICDLREAFYEAIIERNRTQERFRKGWMRRIHEMRDFCTNPSKPIA